MKKKDRGLYLAVLVILVLGVIIFFTVTNHSGQQNTTNAQPETNKDEWKNFSWNGDALTLKYPARLCTADNDCNDLYVVQFEDNFFVGGATKRAEGDYISEGFEIYYLDGLSNQLDQTAAEKYLRTKYDNLPATISWVTDKNNSQVKIANLWGERIFAAYSNKLGVLITFETGTACAFDCQKDQEFLGSIKLDGAALYNTPPEATVPAGN